MLKLILEIHVGGVDRIHLAQDWNHWRALVNITKNFRFPKSTGNFLRGWAVVLSWRTQLHGVRYLVSVGSLYFRMRQSDSRGSSSFSQKRLGTVVNRTLWCAFFRLGKIKTGREGLKLLWAHLQHTKRLFNASSVRLSVCTCACPRFLLSLCRYNICRRLCQTQPVDHS